MSSLQRTIRRKMIFKGMNKHQKAHHKVMIISEKKGTGK